MSTIRDVIERMDTLLSQWDAVGDFRAVFIRSYRAITVRMEQAVKDGEFEDNLWMEALDVRFAQEYFDALEAYESETGYLPTCWKFTFDLARQKKTTVLQDLLLGMNAHILHDLAIALYKMGLDPWQRALRERDHEKINEVLAGMIDKVQDDVSRHYSWALGFLDRLSDRKDELLTDTGTRITRNNAWIMALALTDAPDDIARTAVLRTLDTTALTAARLVTPNRFFLADFIPILRRWDRRLVSFFHG